MLRLQPALPTFVSLAVPTKKGGPFGPPLPGSVWFLRQCCDVLQAQFVGLAEHAVHEQAKDAEDGVEAHV